MKSLILKQVFFLLLSSLWLGGCIGDDIIFDTVDETVRITDSVDSLAVGDSYQFKARFTNNIGAIEERTITWISTDTRILTIDPDGLATGVSQGFVSVIAEVALGNAAPVRDSARVVVDTKTTTGGGNSATTRSGKIRTTSSYVLEGDFILRQDGAKLILEVQNNYRASDRLPGLYIYLTNNANSNKDAFEIGKVEVFQGAHSYELTGVGLRDYDYILYYCKPFSVKVGDGKLSN